MPHPDDTLRAAWALLGDEVLDYPPLSPNRLTGLPASRIRKALLPMLLPKQLSGPLVTRGRLLSTEEHAEALAAFAEKRPLMERAARWHPLLTAEYRARLSRTGEADGYGEALVRVLWERSVALAERHTEPPGPEGTKEQVARTVEQLSGAPARLLSPMVDAELSARADVYRAALDRAWSGDVPILAPRVASPTVDGLVAEIASAFALRDDGKPAVDGASAEGAAEAWRELAGLPAVDAAETPHTLGLTDHPQVMRPELSAAGSTSDNPYGRHSEPPLDQSIRRRITRAINGGEPVAVPADVALERAIAGSASPSGLRSREARIAMLLGRRLSYGLRAGAERVEGRAREVVRSVWLRHGVVDRILRDRRDLERARGMIEHADTVFLALLWVRLFRQDLHGDAPAGPAEAWETLWGVVDSLRGTLKDKARRPLDSPRPLSPEAGGGAGAETDETPAELEAFRRVILDVDGDSSEVARFLREIEDYPAHPRASDEFAAGERRWNEYRREWHAWRADARLPPVPDDRLPDYWLVVALVQRRLAARASAPSEPKAGHR